MRFLVVGGGAREHALGAALVKKDGVEVVVASKHKNPGLASVAKAYATLDETNGDKVLEFAKKQSPECIVIGPEAPLASGVSDRLRQAGYLVAAPSRAAAEIETSKRFMRTLLVKHKVPGNCRAEAYESASAAKAALAQGGLKVALKPIGLTGGKGVRVYGDHFRDAVGAHAYIDEVFQQHIGGDGILIEELLEGEEFTVQCFADGRRILPTPAVQDHKRLLPDDQGPNTGGMGSYTQGDGLLPFLPRRAYEDAVAIVRRIVEALASEGRPYIGPIYGQFMLTRDGPKVIEINARFGDPEAMNVLDLLETPYADIALRMAEQRLTGVIPRFASLATVVKYVVPEGYGTRPKPGVEIRIDEAALRASKARLYYANVETAGTNTFKSGTSRSLAILGRGETLHQANAACEAGLKAIRSDHIHVRHDIGTDALIEKRVAHMRRIRGS